jgi:hypothetical protein
MVGGFETVLRMAYGRIVSTPTSRLADCTHPGVRLLFTPDESRRDVQPAGVERCGVCGATRRVEGDLCDPWRPGLEERRERQRALLASPTPHVPNAQEIKECIEEDDALSGY